jgi:hypothetical protein
MSLRDDPCRRLAGYPHSLPTNNGNAERLVR